MSINRNIYAPSICLDCVKKIDVILFPRYEKNIKPYIRKLSLTEPFNEMLKNIHKHYSMEILYKNINYLVKNADCYYLNYSSSAMAYNLLERERLLTV